jgi:hypothetical protein
LPGPGLVRSGPCPRGPLMRPGVRLGRIWPTLESVAGPGSLHGGSRPRGPRVRPQPAPELGPRGTCRLTAPCPARTRAPGRACDDPRHFVGPPRAGGPHPSLVQRPGAGTPWLRPSSGYHLNAPGPPTGSPDFPGLPDRRAPGRVVACASTRPLIGPVMCESCSPHPISRIPPPPRQFRSVCVTVSPLDPRHCPPSLAGLIGVSVGKGPPD